MQSELDIVKTVKETFSLDMGALTSKDLQTAQVTAPGPQLQYGKVLLLMGFIDKMFFTFVSEI